MPGLGEQDTVNSRSCKLTCSEVNLDLGQIKGSGLIGGHQGVIQLAVLLLSACNTLQCC